MNCIAEGCTSGGKANLTTGLCTTCYKQRMTGRVYAGGRAVLTAPIHFRSPRSRSPQKVRLEQQYSDYQKETEQFAENHDKTWTPEEDELFVKETNDLLVIAENPEDVLNHLYNLAMQMKRRLGAILWAYRICWESDDYLKSNFQNPERDNHIERVKAFEAIRGRLEIQGTHKLPKMIKSLLSTKKKKEDVKTEEIKTQETPAQV